MAERQLSLYWWFKKNPKLHFKYLYPKPTIVIPENIRKNADVWNQWFVSDGKHPGDGVMYFHDFLLSPAMQFIFPYISSNEYITNY